jgi:hypothetical protein
VRWKTAWQQYVHGLDCNSQCSVNIIHSSLEHGILSSRSDSSRSHRMLRRSSMTFDVGLRWIHLYYGRHSACPIIMAVYQTVAETRFTPHCAIKSYCRRVRLHSDPQLLGILKHITVEKVYQRAWAERQGMASDRCAGRSGRLKTADKHSNCGRSIWD